MVCIAVGKFLPSLVVCSVRALPNESVAMRTDMRAVLLKSGSQIKMI